MVSFEFQSQVEEYRQLKDTLKKMPSFQRPENVLPPQVPLATPASSPLSDSKAHDADVPEEQKEVIMGLCALLGFPFMSPLDKSLPH